MRPPISLADLLRAYSELKPRNARERQAIAELLGFIVTETAPTHAAPTRRGEERDDDGRRGAELAPILQPKPHGEQPGSTHPTLSSSAATSVFTISGPQNEAADAPWLSTAREFDSPAPDALPIEQASLFEPKWARSILSTALATQAPIGEVDLALIVERVARAQPLRSLPRLLERTIAPFVQVLRDVGSSMIPFADDQQLLLPAIARVVGPVSLRVLKFVGTPFDGAGTDEDERWPAYQFPAAGTHVLLLTDFGIGRPPMTRARMALGEWRRFAAELRRRELSCTAFVPYPMSRWPAGLVRLFDMVTWDRATTAGSVKFSVRPSLR